MTSKLKVNLINDSGDNNIITSDGSGVITSSKFKIGQVIYGRTTTQIQSTSTSYATTNFSANITPTSTSSKILVIFDIHYQIYGQATDSDFGGNFKIVRTVSSTDTDVFIESNPTPRVYNTHSGNAFEHASYNMTELDEPATTSQCTYTVYQKARNTNNRISLSQDSAISTVTLMEVLP